MKRLIVNIHNLLFHLDQLLPIGFGFSWFIITFFSYFTILCYNVQVSVIFGLSSLISYMFLLSIHEIEYDSSLIKLPKIGETFILKYNIVNGKYKVGDKLIVESIDRQYYSKINEEKTIWRKHDYTIYFVSSEIPTFSKLKVSYLKEMKYFITEEDYRDQKLKEILK